MRALPIVLLFAGAHAWAQGSSSPGYQLESLALMGAGGGSTSPAGGSSFLSLPDLGGEPQSSPSFGAAPGFVEAHDPLPPDLPLVYGVAPPFGSAGGGTAIEISGLNFNLFGTGASIAVDIGGVPVAAFSVDSNTRITCTTAPGAMGPHTVTVSSSLGMDALLEGFVSTPAIRSSPTAVPGGSIEVTNWGVGGGLVYTAYAVTLTSVPLGPLGLLLIGPTPLFLLQAAKPFPPPDGIHVASFPLPARPLLSGLVLYLQSFAITSLVPFEGILTNATTTLVL